ncbi:hypothetical protein PsorP6_001807 [Peronosclerospora sorghi]|uniref:Uncharacterized protein n=1 Tax=Peronosclerospora sorghi TaxID=230839 RepID=A0ACC0WTP6_9STRA|nr:hypothetical protein PsorP6_001807 [Peronosclerospora sorghi]
MRGSSLAHRYGIGESKLRCFYCRRIHLRQRCPATALLLLRLISAASKPCVQKKRMLLKKEGVNFTKKNKIDKACLQEFDSVAQHASG